MLGECISNNGHVLVGDFHELWPYTNELTIQDYLYSRIYGQNGQDIEICQRQWSPQPGNNIALQFSNFADWDVRRGYANQYQLYFALGGLQRNTYPFAGGWGQGINSKGCCGSMAG